MNARLHLTWLVIVLLLLGSFTGVGILAAEKPAGTVLGTITDEAGHALARAKISFSGPTTRAARSQEDGSFRLDGLPVGRYRVSARARGYESQWREETVEVLEGQVVTGIGFALAPRSPGLNFAQHQRVFTPGEQVRLGLRGSLLKQLHFELYRLDLPASLRTAPDLHRLSDATPSAASLVKRWTRPIGGYDVDEDDWFFKVVELAELPPGAYLIQAAGEVETPLGPKETAPADAYWFQVTDLGLITKRSHAETLVYAVDLVTRAPRAGVTVRVLGDKGELWRGVTGPEGLFRHATPDGATLVVAAQDGASQAQVSAYVYSSYQQHRVQLYTERPIYRPGQIASFKGIVRERSGAANRLPRTSTVHVRIQDPQEVVVHEADLPLNDLGSFHGELTVPLAGALGDYRLMAEVAGETHEIGFKVQEYRKPEFKLEIQPERTRYAQGDQIKTRIVASYYFGAPVAGAKLNYTVYSRQHYMWATEEDAFYAGFADGYDFGYQNVVLQGEAVTDADGHATLEIPSQPGDGTQDLAYGITVEGMDAGRQVVKGKSEVLVTRGDFGLNVEPGSYVPRAGTSEQLTLETRDFQGQPVQTEAQLTLEREQYVPGKDQQAGTYRYEAVSTAEARTDARGRAQVRFSVPDQAGTYRWTVDTHDAAGHLIREHCYLWASAESWEGDTYRAGEVKLTLDRKLYHAGDTARVLVELPNEKVHPLFTVEGQDLHEARVLKAGKRTQVLEVPVRAAYEPNVYVTLAVADGKRFASYERTLNVSPEAHFLKLTVEPGQPRYLPGETATVKVTTRTFDDRPVPAEVSLGVVDEAIYAIAPDETSDLRATFWGPSWNRVATVYSFAEDYSGGPAKDAEEPRVRKNFKDTAAWFPVVRTGADGTATVTFPLPDNLTSWVVTVRGHTRATQVGAARAKFVAAKDLMVRLAMPRFLVLGDRVAIAALIHNYTDQDQQVTLTPSFSNLKLDRTLPERVTVPKNGVERLDLWVEPETVATASVQLIARGSTASDALALEVPVAPHGLPEVLTSVGRISGTQELSLTPRGELWPESEQLQLSFAPTPAAAAMAALDYLRRYPYGCIEQTTSRFVPELHAYRLLSGLGLATEGFRADMPARARDGLARITGFQHADGGWGWFSGDASEAPLTAFVLDGLWEAERAGFSPDRAVSQRGLRYLEAQLRELVPRLDVPRREARQRHADDLAAIMRALTPWGLRDRAALQALVKHRGDLSTHGLALAAQAHLQGGQPREARACWKLLLGRAHRDGDLVSWSSGRQDDPWYDLETETTARVVQVGMALEPASPELAGGLRWLITKRQADRWISTRDTGVIVMALVDATVQAQLAGLPNLVTVRRDGRELGRLDLRGAAQYLGGKLTLGAAELGTGAIRLQLSTEGSGSLPFAATLRYTRRQEDIPAGSIDGLKLTRRYYRLDPATYAESQKDAVWGRAFTPEMLARLPELGGNMKSGERVLVRLTVEAARPFSYMQLEDPLPAGAEVVDETSGGWSGQEVRDDRMVFFQRTVATGSTSVYYVLRPELPGKYHVMPARLEGMYAPELRVWSAERQVEIQD